MALAPFLAMTAAEIRINPRIPAGICWMACHFSPYGTGLSNLPRTLPPGSILMVDDITPIRSHDPQRILQQLSQCVETLHCSGVLLDFQRPDVAETSALVEVLTAGLPCPVAVSSFYAGTGSFPVCLPPVPLTEPPEQHFLPWGDRPLWLELGYDAAEITVTEAGSCVSPLPCPLLPGDGFYDETLCCHYRMTQEEEKIKFLLWRTEEDQKVLLKTAEDHGVTCALGLYQEYAVYGK